MIDLSNLNIYQLDQLLQDSGYYDNLLRACRCVEQRVVDTCSTFVYSIQYHNAHEVQDEAGRVYVTLRRNPGAETGWTIAAEF